MATLTIRELDDGTFDRLRLSAEANGRSAEDEVRQMIDQRYRTRAAWAEDLQHVQTLLKEKYGTLPDSTALIREMRDEG